MSWKKYLIPAAVAAVMTGCTVVGTNQAPIIDGPTSTTVYTVQKGDTIYSIARRYGVDPKEVARDNEVTNPALLAVGQKLRISVPKYTQSSSKTTTAPAASDTSYSAKAEALTPTVTKTVTTTAADEPKNSRFIWPVSGQVLKGYGENNKGLDIAVEEGAVVKSAADGQVLFVGTVRGYGNLVIVKHDATYVTAYANNKSIVVKQQQSVKRGQQIAIAGKTDSEPARIHFEIRQNGKPINPTIHLPTR